MQILKPFFIGYFFLIVVPLILILLMSIKNNILKLIKNILFYLDFKIFEISVIFFCFAVPLVLENMIITISPYILSFDQNSIFGPVGEDPLAMHVSFVGSFALLFFFVVLLSLLTVWIFNYFSSKISTFDKRNISFFIRTLRIFVHIYEAVSILSIAYIVQVSSPLSANDVTSVELSYTVAFGLSIIFQTILADYLEKKTIPVESDKDAPESNIGTPNSEITPSDSEITSSNSEITSSNSVITSSDSEITPSDSTK